MNHGILIRIQRVHFSLAFIQVNCNPTELNPSYPIHRQAIRMFRTLALLVILTAIPSFAFATDERPPNIVYIMSDELAYYELSHMGNEKIRTPTIDQMAKDGIRFTQAMAAAPVCAPLRAALMTGKHMGHCSVRANGGGTPLRAGEETIASMLKQKGYATGGFGKWGAGGRDSTGVPEAHGFDVFFGYYDQVHAHSFYPPYLVRNSEEVPIKGNEGGRTGETYSHYEIMKEGLQFIRDHKDQPFFCYFPITPPHGMYDIPSNDPAWEMYRDAEWMTDEVSDDVKNYAAMVSMVDNDVKSILNLLKELNLQENTIVFFTGDNGGQDRFKNKSFPRGFFGPNVNPKTGVEFRGGKGSLYEGGLRIPFIVQWPDKIKPGQVNDLLFSQVDMMKTIGELTGTTPPEDTDGLSILPTLLGEDAVGRKQDQHAFLYWEFGKQTAVRYQHWKGMRTKPDAPWDLYDLNNDVSETTNVADQNPEVVAHIDQLAKASHTPVQSGTFTRTDRHERDRWAKWGTTRAKETGNKPISIREKNLVPFSELSIVGFSSENFPNGRLAAYAIDGKSRNLWHTQFSGGIKKHPHQITIDLGKQRTITGIRYLARQDGGWNGAFAETEFSFSGEDSKFGPPQLSTTFKKSRSIQKVELPQPVTGRYVQIRILSEVNGGPWASAAEIGFIEK